MQPFTRMSGLVLPIDRANVDTDAIIPKQYLKAIGKTGFGVNLFDDWRYLDPGEPYMDHSTRRINADCILNQPRFTGASILLARENYGCGSSREHAVWAMVDYGIRVVIAPSFADIFYNNTLNNGLLAITLDAGIVDRLFAEVAATAGYTLAVDLEETTIITPGGEMIPRITSYNVCYTKLLRPQLVISLLSYKDLHKVLCQDLYLLAAAIMPTHSALGGTFIYHSRCSGFGPRGLAHHRYQLTIQSRPDLALLFPRSKSLAKVLHVTVNQVQTHHWCRQAVSCDGRSD